MDLILYRDRDGLRLYRLRGAVRADFGRMAMIYASPDLAAWIRKSISKRGGDVGVVADEAGNLVISGVDQDVWAMVQRALETTSFD